MSQIADPNMLALMLARQNQLASTAIQPAGMEGRSGMAGAQGMAGGYQRHMASQQAPRPSARGSGSPFSSSINRSLQGWWNQGRGGSAGDEGVAQPTVNYAADPGTPAYEYAKARGGGGGQTSPSEMQSQYQQNQLALQQLQIQEGQQKVQHGAGVHYDDFDKSINSNINQSIKEQHADEETAAGVPAAGTKGKAGGQDWKQKNEQGLSQLDHITKLKDHVDKQLENFGLPPDRKAALQAQSDDLHNQSMGLYQQLYPKPAAAVAPQAGAPSQSQSRYTGDPNNPQQGLPTGNGKPLDLPMMQQFLNAAGNDRDRAYQMAKAQGFTVD